MIKKIIIGITLFLPVAAFAQGGKYIVEGTVGTYSAPAKVYLHYKTKTAFIVDSTAVEMPAAFKENTQRSTGVR